MIVKYYGGNISKKNLFEMTKTTRNGTTAYNIKSALIELGFNAQGYKCKLDDLNNDIIVLPCIASVIINDSYKHFIVINAINFKKKTMIISDPADKTKNISFEEFKKIFNEVIILSYPIKKIPYYKNISHNEFIFNLIKSHKKNLVCIFVLSILITIFSIFTSFYTEYMINGINYYSKKYLLFIFIIFFSIYILKIIMNYFRSLLLNFINQKLNFCLTTDIFRNIIKLPYNYYRNRTTGDILSRINDLDIINDMISKVSLSIFVDLPLTIVSLFILYFISNKLFIIGILILIFSFLLMIFFNPLFKNYIKKIQSKKSESTSYMIESISGFETVKGIHLENDVINRFNNKYIKLLKDIFSFQKLYYFQNMLRDIINDVGFILITFLGIILVIEEEISLGSLFTFTSLLVYFLEPIKNILNLNNIIKEAKSSLNRVLEIMEKEVDNGFLNDYSIGDIEFKNLTFSFNDKDNILKNVNLKIKKESKIMICGKSGSGKSTLVKLLMKYYIIDFNKIFINGVDINNYKNDTIKNNIIYVGQNEILFNDTLYNNLIYDNSKKNLLLELIKICQVNEIIDNNLGYNMLIEENGFNLSGGEKQRIMLLRALLQNFDILIIDEGLNQVDVNLERKILTQLFKKFSNKTIIFISHRLDNLDLFDELIQMDKGVIKN